MPLKLNEKEKLLHFTLETVAGTEAAHTAATVILTKNLSASIGDSDSSTDEFDGIDSRDRAVTQGNLRNTFTFDVPIMVSGTAGAAPPLGAILQACGFAETLQATIDAKYTHANLSVLKTASVMARRNVGGGQDNRYRTKGAMGVLGIEAKVGQRPIFKITGFVGDYIAPDSAANTTWATPNYGTQKTNLLAPLTPDSGVVATLNGKALCLDSFNCSNLSGLKIDRASTMCASLSVPAVVTPEATINIMMPNFTAEFNPFIYADASNGAPKRYPFSLTIGTVAGRKFSLYVAEAQPVTAKETTIGSGLLGCEMGLRFLSPVIITFS